MHCIRAIAGTATSGTVLCSSCFIEKLQQLACQHASFAACCIKPTICKGKTHIGMLHIAQAVTIPIKASVCVHIAVVCRFSAVLLPILFLNGALGHFEKGNLSFAALE